MTEKDLVFECRRLGKLAEPRYGAGAEIVKDKVQGGIGAFLRLADETVLIAGDLGDEVDGLENVVCVARLKRAVEDVAKVDELTDAAVVGILKDGFEGARVAMNVCEDAELHDVVGPFQGIVQMDRGQM